MSQILSLDQSLPLAWAQLERMEGKRKQSFEGTFHLEQI